LGREGGEGGSIPAKHVNVLRLVVVWLRGGGGTGERAGRTRDTPLTGWRLGREGPSTAAPGGGVDRLALDLDVGLLCVAGRGPGAHALLDLCSHGHEGLLHVGGALGAGLQEGDAQVVSELLVRDKGHKRSMDENKVLCRNIKKVEDVSGKESSMSFLLQIILSTNK